MTNPFSKNNYTPSELISHRETLITDIKDLWVKIYANNVISIGTTPLFDLEAIYKVISKNELDLVKTKLAVQAINIGFKSEKELPKNCVYTQIYLLQQLKERKVKLEKLPTRKNEGETVVFTKTFVDKELVTIKYQIEKIQSEINKYNSEASFQLAE
jgi:hypothetical protein